MFKELLFAPANYNRLPTHAFTSPANLGTATSGLWQLLGSVGTVYAPGAALLRGRAVNPR
ncbi:MAG: hypothetical protein EOO62_14280 [Hymenobacter sp.]|nr:MAG: hypothetical protein EOO62_14280 [Hymenobacter sp.]